MATSARSWADALDITTNLPDATEDSEVLTGGKVAKWTDNMKAALVEEGNRKYDILEGKLTMRITAKTKEQAWQEVANVVNR